MNASQKSNDNFLQLFREQLSKHTIEMVKYNLIFYDGIGNTM